MRTLIGLLFAASCAAETPDVVLNGFASATNHSDQQLRGASMNVDIVAGVPRLDKRASLQGVRKVSSSGSITYDSLHLSGDESVRHEIIARYLSAEVNANHERNVQALALNTANYKFRFRGMNELGGHEVYVFNLRPRHKREGAFLGELWIDAQTCLPLRESGRVIQHSIFLRRLTLVREFRIVDKIAVPESTDIAIDTRLVGKAWMTVKLRDLSFATGAGNIQTMTAVQ